MRGEILSTNPRPSGWQFPVAGLRRIFPSKFVRPARRTKVKKPLEGGQRLIL
jgi:hypothetical protein